MNLHFGILILSLSVILVVQAGKEDFLSLTQEHEDLEIHCIENFKLYCKDKKSGFHFQDGCRKCVCSKEHAKCKKGPCEFNLKAGTNAVKYCENVLKRNAQEFAKFLKEGPLKKTQHKREEPEFHEFEFDGKSINFNGQKAGKPDISIHGLTNKSPGHVPVGKIDMKEFDMYLNSLGHRESLPKKKREEEKMRKKEQANDKSTNEERPKMHEKSNDHSQMEDKRKMHEGKWAEVKKQLSKKESRNEERPKMHEKSNDHGKMEDKRKMHEGKWVEVKEQLSKKESRNEERPKMHEKSNDHGKMEDKRKMHEGKWAEVKEQLSKKESRNEERPKMHEGEWDEVKKPHSKIHEKSNMRGVSLNDGHKGPQKRKEPDHLKNDEKLRDEHFGEEIKRGKRHDYNIDMWKGMFDQKEINERELFKKYRIRTHENKRPSKLSEIDEKRSKSKGDVHVSSANSLGDHVMGGQKVYLAHPNTPEFNSIMQSVAAKRSYRNKFIAGLMRENKHLREEVHDLKGRLHHCEAYRMKLRNHLKHAMGRRFHNAGSMLASAKITGLITIVGLIVAQLQF